MGISISSNRYRFPFGYRLGPQAPTYIPWNGFLSGYNSPRADILGPVVQVVTTAVPADLSTMTITGPDGKAYIFQFVYNASVQTLGIKIALPLSGASTAAQVQTAIAAVLSLAQAFPITGPPVVFPWQYQAINTTTGRVNSNVNGTFGLLAFPTGVTISLISASSTFGLTLACVPGKVGPAGAFLPGT